MTRKYNKDNPLLRAELKQTRRDELRREVMKGVNEIREGRFRIYESGDALAEEIIRRGKAKSKAKKK
jgi:hypothetical protein